MVRPLTYTVLSALLATSARAELLLTPTIAEYELDGVKFQQLAFPDDNKKVLYQSPRGWAYSGSANQLILRPPNKSQAEATITKILSLEPRKFDDESLKKLVDEAVALVPKESENVTIGSQEKNPLLINHKETFLVTLSYNCFGQTYNRSILFVNRGKEQIRCQLTCRSADFKDLQKAFLASHYSWQNL
jgi:hypothetical protein